MFNLGFEKLFIMNEWWKDLHLERVFSLIYHGSIYIYFFFSVDPALCLWYFNLFQPILKTFQATNISLYIHRFTDDCHFMMFMKPMVCKLCSFDSLSPTIYISRNLQFNNPLTTLFNTINTYSLSIYQNKQTRLCPQK